MQSNPISHPMINQVSTVVLVMLFMLGCSSQKTTANAERQAPAQGEQAGPPSVDEIFKMDVNNDGKLSKSEIKGPLLRDFSMIDSDSDGFITKSELENAPKPQRGQGPPKK